MLEGTLVIAAFEQDLRQRAVRVGGERRVGPGEQARLEILRGRVGPAGHGQRRPPQIPAAVVVLVQGQPALGELDGDLPVLGELGGEAQVGGGSRLDAAAIQQGCARVVGAARRVEGAGAVHAHAQIGRGNARVVGQPQDHLVAARLREEV